MAINISNTGTTIDSGTKLYIKTENQGSGKVLVSDSDGLVDWVGVKGLVSQDRYIGELYGGGIVVNIWQEGSNENVLIASLQDVTATGIEQAEINFNLGLPYVAPFVAQWSPETSTFKSATSLYDGRSNNTFARFAVFTYMLDQDSYAINFDGYGGYINGYDDWYLPSLYEMRAVWNSASVINKVLGEHNFKFGVRDSVSAKYWTSTEVSTTQVWQLDLTGNGNFATALKTELARMRPVRIERKTIGSGLTTLLDATDKRSYNDSTLSGRWVDLVNSGMTSSYSLTFSSTNNTGPTYSSNFGGYLNFNGNSYIDFYTPIDSAGTVTVEMWCRINTDTITGSNNFMLFGWNLYSVYVGTSTGLAFTTGGGYFWGLTPTQVTNLGLIGNWNHYVFEMRSNVDSNNNRIWVNGVLQTLTLSGFENAVNRNFNEGFGRIGGFRYRNDAYFAFCDISVFKVYKRALTQTEINTGFNKYRRKYDIGVPSTHFIDMTTNPGTFSITQNVKMNIPGKKNLRVLRASVNGTASWVDKNYLFYRPDNQRFVGEYYGGGIIVSAYNYPANVFNYTIMSTKDLNQIVADLKYGGSAVTTLTFYSYNPSSWLSVGQIVKFVVGGTTKSIAITSFLGESLLVTTASGTLNLAIPDGPADETPGTPLVSPALFVDSQLAPTLIEVVVNIGHTFIGDLRINLVAPNGNVINLMNRQNGAGDNLTNTVFSSNLTLPSITTGTQPYTGTFKMNAATGVSTGSYVSNVNTLSDLIAGKTVNGNWYLVVVDGDLGVDGTLVNWSLRVTGIKTTVTLNETLTTTLTYENSKTLEIGTTGLSVPWSANNLVINRNNYDGSANTSEILAKGLSHSAALLCDLYKSDGWGDWYLPSSMELVNAFDALAAVGYISGNNSVTGNYWSSTHKSFTVATYVRVSGGTTSTVSINALKSMSNKVRAFRKVSILSNFKTWGETNPYDEPTGNWYTEAWDEKNWSGYPRVRTSNVVFDFRTDNVVSYNGRFNGFSLTASSVVGSFTGSVLRGVTWSSDEHALLFPFSNNNLIPTYATASVVSFNPVITSTGSTPQPPLTYEVWFKPITKDPSVTNMGVFSTDVVSNTFTQYGLCFYIRYYSTTNSYQPSVLLGGGGITPNRLFYGDQNINPDVWNHIVIVINSLNDVKFYINSKVTIATISGTGLARIVGSGPTATNSIVGNLVLGSYFNQLVQPEMYLSCLRIYRAAFSEVDAKNNYEYDRVRYGL